MESNDKYGIRIQTYFAGKDCVFLITGGQAHIGAAACAYLSGNTVHVETQVIPGHREGQLAQELASLASSTLNRTTAVLIGVHIEGATKKDIQCVVDNINLMMRQELEELLRTGTHSLPIRRG